MGGFFNAVESLVATIEGAMVYSFLLGIYVESSKTEPEVVVEGENFDVADHFKEDFLRAVMNCEDDSHGMDFLSEPRRTR